MRNLVSLLFAAGIAVFLLGILVTLGFGQPPMLVGSEVLQRAPAEVGTANIVTSVVLAYRGIDTLGELSILFAAATAIGLALGHKSCDRLEAPETGAILVSGSDLLFPLLLLTGAYVLAHGHLTPGGGFQGGVILAAAMLLGVFARPGRQLRSNLLLWLEGLAGAGFIALGLAALLYGKVFLAPWLPEGTPGQLLSAGTLPLLYLMVGIKVGAELASLLAHLAAGKAEAA